MTTARQRTEVEDIHELSPMQLGMLFQSLLSPDSGVFLEQQVMRLGTRLDHALFDRAWQALVDSTPAFRSSFHWQDLEKPVQVVHSNVRSAVESLDWTRVGPHEREPMLEAHLAEMRANGFSLEAAPLARVVLIDVSATETWFVWHFHHILLDGWSGQLVLADLVDLYGAAHSGASLVPRERPPYSTFIGWLQEQDSRASETYWTNKLVGLKAPTPLGIERIGGTIDDAPSGELRSSRLVDEALTEQLRDFARRNRITLNTVVQGAWAVLLSRYSGHSDVVFGVVVSGRPAELPGVEDMVGLFINTLPQRVAIDPEQEVVRWLQALQVDAQEVMLHQHVSPLELQRWSDMPPRTRLFNSVVVFESFPTAETSEPAMNGDSPLYLGRTDVAITMMVVPGDTIELSFVVDGHTCDLATIERMGAHFANLLEEIASADDGTLGSLSMFSADERERMLREWNRNPLDDYDRHPIAALLAEQAARHPDRIAFFEEDGASITFEALDAYSSRLAHALVEKGVTHGSIVAVHLPRSVNLVLVFLAILKARAIYLPLDPSYPAQRLALMLSEPQVDLIVTEADLPLAVDPTVIDIESLVRDSQSCRATCPLPMADPDDGAYILYTSGSTGQPKGVLVEHRPMLNRLVWMWRQYPFYDDEVGVVRTSANFVDSFWEFLGASLQGIPSAIATNRLTRDPESFIDFLATHKVTRLWLVPSYLEILLEVAPDLEAQLPHLTFWSVGGEALTPRVDEAFRRAAPHATLYNAYGASEFWDATVMDPTLEPHRPGVVTIGRPISNTEVYVLDDRGRPVPIGVTGDLYVAGVCLARGYLDPELTAERFIPHPFDDDPSARLYDTGDLARFLPDGSIEVVGRRDQQINLRGFRIEPGEVEAVLEAHPSVSEAVVVSRDIGPSDDRLVGYVVPSGPDHDSDLLLAHTAAGLPTHMVPAAIVWLDEMPRTQSGKRDRLRLPAATLTTADAAARVAARNSTEEVLLGLFTEILGVSGLGVNDDFFHSGGHSLLAIRLVSRVRNHFGVELPVRWVFDRPTVARLAELLPTDDALDDSTRALLSEIHSLTPEEQAELLAALEGEASS